MRINLNCLVLMSMILFSCGRDIDKDKEKNLIYFNKVLNPIIMNYYKDHNNEVPDHFDTALGYSHEKYKVVLGHRGDYSGGSLGYYKIDTNIYLFHAIRESDTTADDLVAIYKVEDGNPVRLVKLKNKELRFYLLSEGLSYKEFKE